MIVKHTKPGATITLTVREADDLADILLYYREFVPAHRQSAKYVNMASELEAALDARPEDLAPAGGAA